MNKEVVYIAYAAACKMAAAVLGCLCVVYIRKQKDKPKNRCSWGVVRLVISRNNSDKLTAMTITAIETNEPFLPFCISSNTCTENSGT